MSTLSTTRQDNRRTFPDDCQISLTSWQPDRLSMEVDDPFDDFDDDEFDDEFDDDFEENWDDDLPEDQEFPDTFDKDEEEPGSTTRR